MDADLKERAENVARLQNSRTRFTPEQITEIGQVHSLLTGRETECTSCKVYGLISEINSILLQAATPIKIMANDKGQFKTTAAGTTVIRHTPFGPKVITPENLNMGDNFEWALKNVPHLVEEAKAKTEEQSTDKKGK